MKTMLNLLALAAVGTLVVLLWRESGNPGRAVGLRPSLLMEAEADASWAPETLREQVAAAAEACVTAWGNFLPARVRPQGGSPLSIEGEAYGCVAMDAEDEPVFAVVRYAGGDRTRPRAYSIDALCDENGSLVLGDGALCRHSPLR